MQWFDGQLAEATYLINLSPNLEPIGLHHWIGPSGRGIRDTYRKSAEVDPETVPLFWSIAAKIHRRMAGTPDHQGYPKADKSHLARRYWEMRSHTLVTERYDTISGRLTALWSPTPSIGSGWIPVAVSGKPEGKALVAWWNSTPVRLMLLNLRTKKLTYPSWSLAQLRQVGVPRPDNSAWSHLAEAWEQAADLEMLPLSLGQECQARRIIDRAAAMALDFDEEEIVEWRRRLAVEPTISNRPASVPL